MKRHKHVNLNKCFSNTEQLETMTCGSALIAGRIKQQQLPSEPRRRCSEAASTETSSIHPLPSFPLHSHLCSAPPRVSAAPPASLPLFSFHCRGCESILNTKNTHAHRNTQREGGGAMPLRGADCRSCLAPSRQTDGRTE